MGGVSGERDQPGEHAGIVEGSMSVDGLSRGCCYRLESGLVDKTLGALHGRGSFRSFIIDVAEAIKERCGELSQSFCCAFAVPDRGGFRARQVKWGIVLGFRARGGFELDILGG